MADRRFTASMLALACDLYAAGELKPEEAAAMLRQAAAQARVLERLTSFQDDGWYVDADEINRILREEGLS